MAIAGVRTIKDLGHQRECWAALDNARAEGADKALVIMASGLGKTIMAILDAKRFIEQYGGRVLILCHRNDILDQLRGEFEDVMNILGGEYSFGMYNGNEKTDTEFGKKDGEKVDFLFGSFQTFADDILRGNFQRDEFSYIIVDEAHHAPARTFYRTLKYFTPKFLLGMTATPDRKDKADLNAIFGKTVFDLRFAMAIAKKLLTEPRVRLLMDEVAKLGEIYWKEAKKKISASELNKRMFAEIRDEAIVKLIHEEIAMAGISDPRTVIFCRGVKHAENIASLIDGAVLFHSYYRGDYTQKDAKKNLQDFRDGTVETIVVIDKLNEGIDVPAINVQVNLRQLGSRIPAEQQLGRGLRLYPGKDFVLILDFVANCKRLKMYWEMDRDIKAAKIEAEQKVHPDDLKIPGGGGASSYDVTGLNISTNDPHFQREDLDLMGVISEIVAMTESYTKEELIEQLQRKAKELGRTPTATEVDTDKTMADRTTFDKVFGSYVLACIAAGLKPNKEYYARDYLIALLREWSQDHDNKVPTADEIETDPKMPSVGTYQNEFGSWVNALIAAGFDPKRQYYTDEELLTHYKRKAIEVGGTPTRGDINNDPSMPSTNTYCDRFGSTEAVAKRLGLKPNVLPSYNEEELLEQMRKKIERSGNKIPIQREVAKDPLMASVDVFIKVFGSWENVFAKLGKKPRRTVRPRKSIPSYDVVVKQIQDKARALGRNPTKQDVIADPLMESYNSICARWVGFNKALRAAGLPVDTETLIILQLQRMHRDLNRYPTYTEIEADEHGMRAGTIIRIFGSLKNAFEEATRRFDEMEQLRRKYQPQVLQ